MKARIAKAALVATEVIGVAVAAALGLAAFIIWRAQSGPVDLSWTGPALKSIANAASFSGAVRTIGDITLEKLDDKGGWRLTLAEVRLGKAKAEATAIVPAVSADFYPRDFLAGKAGPRRIMLDGAELRIIRRADRRIRLDFGELSGERTKPIAALTGGSYFRDAFERAELRRVRINFTDAGSGRSWRGENASAVLQRTRDGYRANLAASFDVGEADASVNLNADYSIESDLINASLNLESAPVGDIVAIFHDASPDLFTSLVSGTADLRMRGNGAIVSSSINFVANAGVMRLGNLPIDVEKMSLAAEFRPGSNFIKIERFAIASGILSGKLSGAASVTPDDNGTKAAAMSFTIAGQGLQLSHPDHFPEPLEIASAEATGRYDFEEKALDLTSIKAALNDVKIDGRLFVQRTSSASPAVRGAMALDGSMNVPELLAIWPASVAEGARRFVAERVTDAAFSAVEMKIDLPAGAIGENGVIPDDAMELVFRADDADVVYAPGMTPLTAVAGRGVLKGNSFRFVAERANADAVVISDGLVDIPVIAPKGELAHYSFRARGDAETIMRVLAQPPLDILKETKLSPSQFSGDIDARVTISRPNLSSAPANSYRYEGTARFSNAGVSSVFNDVDLDRAVGTLSLKTNGLTVRGEGALAAAPVAFMWRQRFYGAGDKTFLQVSGIADSAAADLFGVPSRQFLHGKVAFEATARGELSAFRSLEVMADFTDARLVADQFDWMKPSGVKAEGRANFTFGSFGVDVSDIRLAGEGINIEGDASFGGGGSVKSAVLPVFQLNDAADLSVSAMRGPTGDLLVTAAGDYLNAGAMVRNLVEGGLRSSSQKSAEAMNLTARIERLDLRAGTTWRDATLDFRRSSQSIEGLQFSAIDDSQKSLSISLRPSGEGALGDQSIDARADDVGALIAGLFGISSISGGRGHLALDLFAGENTPRPGLIEANGIRVTNAPLLAKIFAAGSLTGLADLVNGDGIELTAASAEFAIENGVVRVMRARATGPSVGLTAQGSFGLGESGEFNLAGAVAPAYGVNSFLGKTPIIGDIFVNREGEGVVALAYSINGPASEPKVTVNPLSALTPGVLRRMFEAGNAEGKATE